MFVFQFFSWDTLKTLSNKFQVSMYPFKLIYLFFLTHWDLDEHTDHTRKSLGISTWPNTMGKGVTAIKKSKKSISPLTYHVNWCMISFTEVRTKNCFILSPTGYNNWSHTHLSNIGKVSSQLISGSKNIEISVRGRVSTLLQKNLKKKVFVGLKECTDFLL